MEDTTKERGEKEERTLGREIREEASRSKSAGEESKKPTGCFLSYKHSPVCSFTMTSRMVEMLNKQAVLPLLPGSSEWSLVYSSEKHGFSLSTLIGLSRKRSRMGGVFILSVLEYNTSSTEYERVFGAVFSTSLDYAAAPYGDVHTSLFRFSTRREEEEKSMRVELSLYPACAQEKGFYIMSKTDYLAFGCSNARFGLRLERTLLSGESHEVSTFQNERLSHKNKFMIKQVELWHISP
ncbi:hypothetical protein NECID01_0361 [Nematocida sp. AWRm77]|nr:hypothetical protein NECID01_0361 [Nematocida sp. AWRm77]